MNFCHKHCKDLLIEEIKCNTCYLKQVDHPHKSSYVLRLAKQAIFVPINGNLLCCKIDTNLFMNDWAVFLYHNKLLWDQPIVMELLYFPIKFYFMESAVNCLRPLELSQRQCLSNVLPGSHFGLALYVFLHFFLIFFYIYFLQALYTTNRLAPDYLITSVLLTIF